MPYNSVSEQEKDSQKGVEPIIAPYTSGESRDASALEEVRDNETKPSDRASDTKRDVLENATYAKSEVSDGHTLAEESPSAAYASDRADSNILDSEFEQDLPPKERKRDRNRGSMTPILVGIGIGVALGVAGTRFLPGAGEKPATVAKAPPTPPPSMTVTVAPVETTQLARTLETTGTVAAYDMLPVLPQTTGLQVKQVMASEGQRVQVGQVLAILDDSVLQSQISGAKAQLEAALALVQQKQAAKSQTQAALAQSQASLAEARARFNDAQTTLKRYQTLADKGAISLQDLDTRRTAAITAAEAVRVAEAAIASSQANIRSAEANITSAQADVRNNQAKIQQLETQLGQTLVKAPASGIVAEKSARVGDVSSGSQKLFQIIRNGVVELQVNVPEPQLPEVRVGAPAIVTSNADSRIRLQGRVREIAPMVEQQTRLATVKIDLPSNVGEVDLRPGMFLKAAITSQTAQGLTVPAKSVLPQTEGKAVVYLLDANNIVHQQTVELGTNTGGDNTNSDNAKSEIKRGLKLGDRVVVAGAGYLKDGDKVQLVSGK